MTIYFTSTASNGKDFSNMLFFGLNVFFHAVVFFSDVGGSSLDSHHGFVVEYGKDKDVELGRYLVFMANTF